MEMLFIVLVIGAGILAVVGPIIWVAFIIYAACKASEVVANVSAAGGFESHAVTSDLDSMLAQVDQMLRASSTGQAPGGHWNGAHLSPQKQLEIQNMMMQTQNQMRQLDDLSRQRYETRMADLSGMAASAGIDWTPGSYS